MSNITPEVLSFIEEIGLDYERLNLPRIAGRIMGLLLVTTDPLSSQQIASTLQISLGSVSTNMNLLLQMGVVEKKSLIGDRINYYILASDSIEKEVMDMLSTTISRQAIFTKYLEAIKDDETVKQRFQESIETLEVFRKFYVKYLSDLRSSNSENKSN
ncbi:transcriptional regulator [Brevibacillus fluminis]|uniref:Transcriptional regulator n=1 Tax=Brevibacillus fluminis TaxID=511487 RepID=A0A3M8D267_9BACL|nr:transcriptional regulator [Brevibacillus fluminis]RNB81285.1 transcriptional regulator [Brevibacillus fluminis]